uniref:Dehydrogenase/reductase (SDR family) member 13a, tandem duplicate 1 n=1 Tax=Oncorhynchus mykiss TaxID=8022 RepID=A0A8C7UEH7_ONCMY
MYSQKKYCTKMFTLLLVSAGLIALYVLRNWYLKRPRCKSNAKLHGKTVIVTGSNTGIGKTTAIDLSRRGARVIMACRDKQRAEAAISDIKKETGNNEVVFMELDLGSLQSVRSFAETFLKSEFRLDILVNNAGLMKGGKTKNGVGMIFGVNHLGHFLLTVLLLDRLKECGPSRVVTVASKAHEYGKIDFNCLSTHKDLAVGESDWALFKKYSHSKLCNMLFTHELAKRLEGTNVTCYSLCPGAVKTEIGRYSSFLWCMMSAPILSLFCMDAESGAQTTLYCALQEGIEPLSGCYFSCCAVQKVNADAKDDAVAKKLWEVSERLCGMS